MILQSMRLILGAERAETNANKFSGDQRVLGDLFESVTFFKNPTLIFDTRGPTAGLVLLQQPKNKDNTAPNFLMELGVRFDPLIK